MMKLSAALWLAIAVAAPAIAQDATPKGSAEAAKAKNSMCIGCHGVAGYRTAFPDVFHFRHFFRTFIDQKYYQVTFRMIMSK